MNGRKSYIDFRNRPDMITEDVHTIALVMAVAMIQTTM